MLYMYVPVSYHQPVFSSIHVHVALSLHVHVHVYTSYHMEGGEEVELLLDIPVTPDSDSNLIGSNTTLSY